ncbi:MAG: hypothetical protein HC896_18310 [Bacteroidales bacterium]|nr:hypothetical protein [Bacteroidales bacterium]
MVSNIKFLSLKFTKGQAVLNYARAALLALVFVLLAFYGVASVPVLFIIYLLLSLIVLPIAGVK